MADKATLRTDCRHSEIAARLQPPRRRCRSSRSPPGHAGPQRALRLCLSSARAFGRLATAPSRACGCRVTRSECLRDVRRVAHCAWPLNGVRAPRSQTPGRRWRSSRSPPRQTPGRGDRSDNAGVDRQRQPSRACGCPTTLTRAREPVKFCQVRGGGFRSRRSRKFNENRPSNARPGLWSPVANRAYLHCK